jgi:hypothetical protein
LAACSSAQTTAPATTTTTTTLSSFSYPAPAPWGPAFSAVNADIDRVMADVPGPTMGSIAKSAAEEQDCQRLLNDAEAASNLGPVPYSYTAQSETSEALGNLEGAASALLEGIQANESNDEGIRGQSSTLVEDGLADLSEGTADMRSAATAAAPAAAVGGSNQAAPTSKASSTTTTPTTVAPSQSLQPAPAALRQVVLASFSGWPDYELSVTAKFDPNDPTWAVVSVGGAPGYEDQVQGGGGIAHLINGTWTMMEGIGSAWDETICTDGQVPASVADTFGFNCS